MKPVIAIAANSLRALLRRPSSYAFLVLVGLSAFALPRIAGETGTLRSRLQAAVVWGIGPSIAIAAFGILVHCAASISADFESLRIQAVFSKPCSPGQLFLGKLAAAAAAGLVLVLVILGGLFVNVTVLWDFSTAPPEERSAALERFFTPRVPVPWELAEVRLEAAAPSSEGASPEPRILIPPGGSADLVLARRGDLGLSSAGSLRPLLLTVKVYWSPPTAGPRIGTLWEIRELEAEAGAPPRHAAREDLAYGVLREISIPASAAAGAEKLLLRAVNLATKADGITLVLHPRDVTLWVPSGRFWLNALACFALLEAQLVLLAALTLFASSFFSFGTSALFGMFLYGTDLASGFLEETLAEGISAAHDSWLGEASRLLCIAGRAILSLLPRLGGLEPIDAIATATALVPEDVARRLVWILFVETGLVTLACSWLLARREAAGGLTG